MQGDQIGCDGIFFKNMVIHTADQVHGKHPECRCKKLLFHIIKSISEADTPIVGTGAV